MSSQLARSRLADLLLEQRFGVLATAGPDGPHAGVVAYAVFPDLRSAIFCTPKATRKYENIRRDPRVALVLSDPDDLDSANPDLPSAITATVSGIAETPPASDVPPLKSIYLNQLPYMEELADAPDTALLSIRFVRAQVIRNVDHVEQVCYE